MNHTKKDQLDRMFNPKGLAFFGGIASPGAFGNLIALSQIRYGYKGSLYPISPKGGKIAGHKIYKSLDEVPGPVDLACVSVPARAVPEVLQDCLDHGVNGVQVHSSGFAETGKDEGIELQREIVRIARQGLRIVGPNCFGLHSPKGGITVLPGSDFSKEPGSVALISQSGGVATDFGYTAQSAGMGISKVISFGNGCDVDALELMEYMGVDPETQYIAAYLEGIQDGPRFLEAVKLAAKTKPVVIWKAGLTPLGNRAAQSHTGSLAGGKAIWEGVLAQAGAASVKGLDEAVDALAAAYYLKKPGPRVAVVGGGGAIGVFSCDLASQWGLDLPRFSDTTRRNLRKHFPTPGNSMANPLDTGSPVVPVETMQASIKEIALNEPIDVVVVILLLRPLELEVRRFMEMAGMDAPPSGAYLEQLLGILTEIKQETGKDIAVVMENRAGRQEDLDVEATLRRMRDSYQAQGFPVFSSAERALRGISHAAARVRFLEQSAK
ncbi:MAG: CoA-binding protein [Thermodesulfobacteriota bacterium]